MIRDTDLAELQRKLLGTVRRACPSWLRHHAEDIVQVAMTRVLSAERRRGGGAEPLQPSYFHKAALSAVIDEVRARVVRKEEPLDPDRDVPDRAPTDAAGTLALHDALRGCLVALLAARRAAVACHLLGYSVPEASAFLGFTRKKTEHLTSRGMEDLRTCLDAKGIRG